MGLHLVLVWMIMLEYQTICFLIGETNPRKPKPSFPFCHCQAFIFFSLRGASDASQRPVGYLQAWLFRAPFPPMHPFKDWGKGGNFKKGVEGEDRTHGMVIQFLFPAKDQERIYRVVTECKRLKLEKEIGGQHCFWQIIPDKPNDDQIELLFNHGCVQNSTGSTPLWGLKNPDYEVKVELEPDVFDEDGNGIPR